MRAGRGGRHLRGFLDHGIVAIGWYGIGQIEGHDRSVLRGLLEEHYGPRGAAAAAGMLDRFAHDMRVGDLVLTPDPPKRELHHGVVTGGYEWVEPPPVERYPHVRRVEWRGVFSRDELPKRVLNQLSTLLTLSTPSAQEELRRHLSRRN